MLINGHAHVFNLRSVLTRHAVDIIKKRVRGELRPRALGDAVAEVVEDLFQETQNGAGLDEGRIVRDLLEKLTGNADFGDLRKQLPALAGELLDRGLDKLSNALLFRLVDGLDRVLNRRRGDARSANLTDVLALLRLALQAETRQVALRLMHQLGPDRGAVALMMDITNGDGSDDRLFEKQTEDLSRLVLEYPGRIFPFFAVHARRSEVLKLLQTALTEQGFVGVKLYPALGSDVASAEIRAVLAEAARSDTPVLSHTTPGGFFESDAAIDLGDPVHWRPLLDQIPGFRICFAHFGGSSNLASQPIPGLGVNDPRRRWTRRILDLMAGPHGDRVFADLSYHEAPMETREAEIRYFDNLKTLLADPDRRDQLLFGTDFWVVRKRLSEGSYWRFFEDGVDTSGLTVPELRRLAETNNHRFLGLPLESPSLAMGANIQRYVRFVHRHRDELQGRPAPWLLEAIRSLHGAAAADELAARQWPLADALNAPDWSRLLDSLVQDVLDSTVSGVTADSPAAVEASFGFEAAPIGFQGDGELSIAVFNSTDQFLSDTGSDADRVIAPPPFDADADDPFAEFTQPAISFDPQSAWVKYRAEGRLKLQADTSLGLAAVGLEASASRSVALGDYRRHGRQERLRNVVADDLRWPRFALDAEDVLRLEPGDAVFFQTHGRLAARLTLSMAEVFTFGLARLARGLGSANPLSVTTRAGASISAEASVEDDFRIVFSRQGVTGRAWRAEVRKVETRGRGFTAEIGAELRFSDPEAAAAALASVFEQAVGDPLNRVEALLDRTSLADLGPNQRKLFDRVAEKLDLASLDDLRQRIAKFKESLAEIARQKLELGFAYEYSRIETDTALLVADLDREAVAALHGQLVRGNLEPLLDWPADPDPAIAGRVQVVRYQLTEEEVTRRSFGFSLAFGRWLDLAQKDETVILRRRQRSRLDTGETAERFAYLASRTRTDRWMNRQWTWQMDLDARMDRTSSHPEPETSDFTYNLAFGFDWSGNLSQNRLDEILDAAALWGVLPAESGGPEELRRQLDVLLAPHGLAASDLVGQSVDCRLQLLFDQIALALTLPRAKPDDEKNLDRMARSLAAAMPFRKGSTVLRNLPERRRVYAGLFKLYLTDVEDQGAAFDLTAKLPDYRKAAAALLKQEDHKVQARREDESHTLSRIWTFAGMLHKNSRTAEQWSRGLAGLGMLADGVGRITGTKHTMIKGLFNDLFGFWKQTHHMRAFGAYLLDAARVQGLPEGVRPGLELQVDLGAGEGDGEKTVIPIGPGTG